MFFFYVLLIMSFVSFEPLEQNYTPIESKEHFESRSNNYNPLYVSEHFGNIIEHAENKQEEPEEGRT